MSEITDKELLSAVVDSVVVATDDATEDYGKTTVIMWSVEFVKQLGKHGYSILKKENHGQRIRIQEG